MPEMNVPPDTLVGSNEIDLLQRLIDQEAIAAGLNCELVSSDEIRLRAVVSARKTSKSIPIAALETAITLLEMTGAKHCASKEVAAINAHKKKRMISIFPKELKKAKKREEFKTIAQDQQSEWAQSCAWGECQLKIQMIFGSPAPAEWSTEARHWAHQNNLS
jgi:hypothetical protein